ncbi:MAG TPA: tyrosine-type recombinase/integrase [Gaiellales bacterium]|nr:tyrosine-type recombinase/integrase [Gaiellales bacterium]
MNGQCWQLPDGRWRIRWRTPSGRRPSETYRLKGEAERALRRHVDESERGVELFDRRMTLAQFYPEWEAATRSAVKPRSWEAYSQHWRTHIRPSLGHLRLVGIDGRAAQRFVDALARDGLSPKTVRCVHGTLYLMLRMGAGYGLCSSPDRVRLPRVEQRELTIPTPEQVERLAAMIDARLWALVRLCGYAGLRQGEALALRPEDVDWLRRRAWVGATLNKRTRKRESPKSGRGRWVTLPTIVVDALAQHVAEHPADGYVFHRQGRPWPATKVWAAWEAARNACGMDGVRFHDLRHSAASLMIAAGWSPKRVQVELGHADPAFTLRVYGHLWPDEIEAGRRALDAVLADHVGPHMDHEAAADAVNPRG